MSLIDPRVLARVEHYRGEFAQARPFRHAVIPGFLDHDLCARLLADFPGFEARHALNEMGEVGGKAVRMDVRDISDAYRELDAYLQGGEFLGFVSRVTGIPDLLYDPDYVGGGTHENRNGQGLDAHVDFNYHPRTRWHRRLNLIVYLNPRWEAEWGGELELHSDPWDEARDERVCVAPTFDTCVIFETTENSWHGFSRIDLPASVGDLSRRSFAIYLYTRERPPEHTAPPHATVYVPQTMPRDWQPGRTLDAADLRDMEQRFTRLRSQLRYLYDRERGFGAQIASLEGALGELRDAQRLQLQGYATQPSAARGLWPDGWAGEAVSIHLVPTRPAKSLRLEVWSPPQLGNGQTLRIELAGAAFTQVLRPGMRTPVELRLRARAGEDVHLTIRASGSWMPSADGSSRDERALAFRILTAALEH
jgi:2-oxoglutarate-Fe(II)-dependent oxygenase superfamily protein